MKINYITKNKYKKGVNKLTKEVFNNKLYKIIRILENLKIDNNKDDYYE